jgi:hypothetical protein
MSLFACPLVISGLLRGRINIGFVSAHARPPLEKNKELAKPMHSVPFILFAGLERIKQLKTSLRRIPIRLSPKSEARPYPRFC